MPVILYQLWAFIAPGLTAQERALARPWVPVALLLGWACVVAWVILPFAVSFLLGFRRHLVYCCGRPYFGFVTRCSSRSG